MPQLSTIASVLSSRTFYRSVLFAAIALLSAWSTFSTFSAGIERKNQSLNNPIAETSVAQQQQLNINRNYGKLPLSFEGNRGQIDSSIDFVARTPGYTVALAPTEAIITLSENRADRVTPRHTDLVDNPDANSRVGRQSDVSADEIRQSVVKIRFAGADAHARVDQSLNELPGKVNYFIGHDSSRWITEVPTYSSVKYKEIYRGIDLVYYGNNEHLEYDLVVNPGADPRSVKVDFEGAKNVRIDREGNLLLKTDVGELEQLKPVLYQEENGERVLVDGRYVFKGKNSVGFQVRRYDKRKPLIIDPRLKYLSRINGAGSGFAITVDSAGNAYITGSVSNTSLNSTPGVFQGTFGGVADVFVTKLNSNGRDVVYTTYLGGPNADEGYSIATDSQGNAYITGFGSSGFPTTPGAYKTTVGGSSDCFVTKLNPSGSALLFSTFYGGNQHDEGNGIKIDASGNVYVGGLSLSTDLPMTAGALQTINAGGYDAYAAKFNSTGSTLIYATYIGGGGTDIVNGSIGLDAAGNVYLSGQSNSLNYPTVNSLFSPAGTDRGLFKSTNAGSAWNLSRTGLQTSYVFALAIHSGAPNTIYAGTAGGVSKSTDGGVTWSTTGATSGNVMGVAIEQQTPATVYAATIQGVYKSLNGGSSWTVSLATSNVQAVAIHPTTPTTVYAGNTARLSRTTDGGANWTATTLNQNVRSIVIDPVTPTTVYAATGAGVFKSTNGGTSWTAFNTGLPNLDVRCLALIPSTPQTIYAGTNAGVFKTTNGATNWAAANTGLQVQFTDNVPRVPAIGAIAIDPVTPNTLYAASNAGTTAAGAFGVSTIFKSVDAGANWTANTNGFSSLSNGFVSLAIDPSNPSTIYAGNSGDTEGFLTKLNATGTQLVYSTYLTGDRFDAAAGVAVDATNNAYVVGYTQSSDFPTTPGAFQTAEEGFSDIFVSLVNAQGSALAYSTYLGGALVDRTVGGIAVDSNGNAYVSGYVTSTDFPVTPGAFQTTIGNPGTAVSDQVVAKLNSSGSALVFASYLGGAGNELVTPFFGSYLALDNQGAAYVVGNTSSSSSFPAFDSVNGFGETYVAKIDESVASYSITGRITNSTNAPIAGVFVEAVDGNGTRSSGTTDSQGFYAIINLPAGNYVVTPDKFGSAGHYVYSPTSRTFNNLSSDQTAANFTATQVYDIFGQITSASNPGLGIFDVTINITGSANVSTVTDANGFFSIRDLVTGNYTVTPSKAGFTFNPVNRVFNGLNADQFASFTTTSGTFFTVSGRAADASNNGISNATVAMLLTPQLGQASSVVQTDANGNYSFTNLQAGGNYSFTIAKALTTFTPQSPLLTNLSSNQTLNFTGSAVTGLIGKITFISDNTNLSVMNADTTGEVNLTSIGSQCSSDSGPAWSPDGAKIAFSRCDGENLNLYTINPDGTGIASVLSGPVAEVFPSWAPDGKRFTYTYGECSGADHIAPDVFSTDVEGKIQTRLTNTVIVDGISDWSPNGSNIVFSRVVATDCSSADVGDLYAIDSAGGNERRLTNTADGEFKAVYSPDGTKIAYTKDIFNSVTNRFSSNIFLMNPDGSNQTKITPDSLFAEGPTWSPDGTKIAFEGSLSGSSQIFVVNVDGTGLAQLTSGATIRRSVSWQHFSISGKVNGITDGQPVTMALAGTLTRVTQTDVDGNYIFGNLTPGGNYSVSPVSTAFVFNPAKTDINNLQGNQIANFAIVPQAIPSPTPPLADDFNGGQRDPAKWNLGTQTQPLGAFDPQVTVVQQGGQLVITPRNNQPGLHYNGYVSVNSFDFNNATATVELTQAASGAAQTIFAIGSDLDNYARFVVSDGTTPNSSGKDDRQRKRRPGDATQLIFQVVVGGQLTSVSIPYDPVAHRYMRFRHEPPTNAIVFETSPNNINFTERHRVTLQKSVSALTAELSAGTSSPTNPGTASFDNFQLVTNTFQFSTTDYTVNESAGSVPITVTRAGSTTSAATVDFSTFDGTAQQRTKYIPAVGVLSFAPGETSKTFDVLIQDNGYVEGSQTVSLRLLSSFGAGLNSPGQGILTINDNDTVAGNTNPLDQPDYFVRQQYFDFLNRAPDSGGFNFWVGQITSCPPGDQACINARRIRVSNAFFYEQEFQLTGAYVYRLYRAAFGNNQPFPNPDPGGAESERKKVPSYEVFVSDRARVVGGAGLAQSQLNLANAFVLRNEFLATYPLSLDGAGFVDAILAKIKNDIGADLTSQRNALITNFNQGGRGLVLYHLANDYWNDCQRLPGSPAAPCLPSGFGPAVDNRPFVDEEYRRAFVVTQYFGYLRRDADMGGLLFWLGQVNRFALRNTDIQNAMVCSFITSAEYQQRFSSAVTHTNQECPQ